MRKVYQNQKAEADWAQVKWKKKCAFADSLMKNHKKNKK